MSKRSKFSIGDVVRYPGAPFAVDREPSTIIAIQRNRQRRRNVYYYTLSNGLVVREDELRKVRRGQY